MRLAITFIFMIFQLTAISFPQGNKNDSTQTDIKKTSISNAEKDEMNKMLIVFENKIDSLLNKNYNEVVGKFLLYRLDTKVYSSASSITSNCPKYKIDGDDSKNVVNIEKVELNVNDGEIEFLRVYATDPISKELTIFERFKSISLQSINIDVKEIRLFDITGKKYYIKLNDFLYYLPNLGEYFAPDNGVVTLTKDDLEKNVASNSDLNSYLDLKIYSDFLSIFNKSSNGIIQTEAASKFFVNYSPCLLNVIFLNYLEISLRYSKFDSQFNSLRIDRATGPVYLSTNDLIKMNQLSYLSLGLKINLFHFKFLHLLTEINIGTTYDFTDLQFLYSDLTHTLNFQSYYYESKFAIARSKYFGLNLSMGILWEGVPTSDVPITRVGGDYLIPEITLYYTPKGDASNKLFLRFKSFSDVISTDSYSLLQFGYSTKINFNSK
ncbi:MAG: hypothetical protein ACM3P0_00510 [Acidobacteriota bacterium]